MNCSIDWGSIADWIAAVSTLGALIFLALERLDSKAEAAGTQAKHISTWVTGYNNTELNILVQNASSEPVFNVVISVVLIQGAGIHDAKDHPSDFSSRIFIGTLPPGHFNKRVEFGGHGVMTRFGLEIGFTDCYGRHWARKGSGQLKQINTHPAEYYSLKLPVGWGYV